MERYTDEMMDWLFDLAHGDLKEDDIVKGFIKHYALYDESMQDVKRHIIYHTNFGGNGAVTAMNALKNAFENVAAEKGVGAKQVVPVHDGNENECKIHKSGGRKVPGRTLSI